MLLSPAAACTRGCLDLCNQYDCCRRCAPIIQSFGMAAASIWKYDSNVPIMLNGLGQNRAYYKDQSGGNYESMTWGDGFITDKDVVKKYNLSDPSQFLTTLSHVSTR